MADGDGWRRAGDISVMPAGEEHDESIGCQGAFALLATPKAGRRDRIRRHSPVLERWGRYRGPAFVALCLRVRSETEAQDDLTALALEGLLLELVAEMSRLPAAERDTAAPEWLLRSRCLVEESLSEPLTLAQLAQEVGISRTHLSRAFRRAFGDSIGGYRRRCRLEEAARQILRSDRPLADVALECGFCDQSHLSKSFRRHFGLTPGAFRRRGRTQLVTAAAESG